MTSSRLFPPGRVSIMGVLNVTPDSFSDGGELYAGGARLDRILEAAAAHVRAGADWLDVGGESTRPGAVEVPVEQELERVAPAVEVLVARFEVPVSIDTRKAAVAEQALELGAAAVNDVSGLGFDREVAPAVAKAGAGLILGHCRGTPETMQDDPRFADPLGEVASELAASVDLARAAGISDERLAIDPGIGFGKRLEDNLALLARPDGLRDRLGLPVLLGPSRKSFLGRLTGEPLETRDAATAAVCAVAACLGADALRVHDVAGAVRAVRIGEALRRARQGAAT